MAMSSLDKAEVTDTKEVEAVDQDGFTPQEQRRITRRVDLRLVTTCGAMYCISLMDRINLSSAAIAGLLPELQVSGTRYSIIALVFFITYVLTQPAATLICRKIGPRLFLGSIVSAWGIIMISFGFAKHWYDLVILRLVLGALEAGAFPSCLYLISAWYCRYDTHKRLSMFYFIGMLASAFSGILAYGLMQMEGLAGYLGWRWIFIMEGIITCMVGIAGYIFLVDFPDRVVEKPAWGFLSQQECRFVMRKINEDRSDAELEPFQFKLWISNALDPKIWGFAILAGTNSSISYSIAYFLPIILRGMGFSTAAAQCLFAPPYLFAAVLMMITSWIGDRFRTKAPLLVINCVLIMIGVALMGYSQNNGIRYFGVFLCAAGANANLPTLMAYQANNVRGHWKRAFSSATWVALSGIGGIAGSLVFKTEEAPLYRTGVYSTFAFNGASIVVTVLLAWYLHMKNKQADRGKIILEGLETFRYTI